MSTKIYDAYICNAEFSAIMTEALEVRERIINHWKGRSAKLFKGHINTSSDLADPEFKPTQGKGDDLDIFAMVAQGIRFGERMFNPCCDMVIYPHPDKKRTVLHFFGLDRDLEKLVDPMIENLKATDYHYQNQCDHPEEITSAEWRQRKKSWDKILGKYGVPARRGFAFDFITSDEAGEQAVISLFLKNPPLNGWKLGNNETEEDRAYSYAIYHWGDIKRAPNYPGIDEYVTKMRGQMRP